MSGTVGVGFELDVATFMFRVWLFHFLLSVFEGGKRSASILFFLYVRIEWAYLRRLRLGSRSPTHNLVFRTFTSLRYLFLELKLHLSSYTSTHSAHKASF